jgi:hypothetical protein
VGGREDGNVRRGSGKKQTQKRGKGEKETHGVGNTKLLDDSPRQKARGGGEALAAKRKDRKERGWEVCFLRGNVDEGVGGVRWE